jgi:hypothetical protein
MAMPTKRERARAAGMATVTRVAGDKMGDGYGNTEGNGDQRR